MSWNQAEFDCDKGVLIYLRKLASSPLVRRSLPNAAAIMSQYFQFRRGWQESIASFLVRETLGFEEFVVALYLLRDEKQGVDPTKRDFGLPDVDNSWDDWNW